SSTELANSSIGNLFFNSILLLKKSSYRDHYFIFDIENLNDSKLTKKYVYQRTTSIRQKD
ncbi:TPA: DUF5960 family protein, partial [Streptococcus suis]